jgi:hypothetical protein
VLPIGGITICDNTQDYDDVIKKWMNSRVILQVDKTSKWEPSKSTSEIEWYKPKGDMMVHFEQEHCETINIGTKDQFAKMIIKADIIGEELERKLNFFEMNKIVFAWSYIDLKECHLIFVNIGSYWKMVQY